MKLHRTAIVMERFGVRSSRDQRKRVNCVTAEYIDADGLVYRKSFESRTDRQPTIPTSGTHAELQAVKYQGV